VRSKNSASVTARSVIRISMLDFVQYGPSLSATEAVTASR
jgi:hypothetical protein